MLQIDDKKRIDTGKQKQQNIISAIVNEIYLITGFHSLIINYIHHTEKEKRPQTKPSWRKSTFLFPFDKNR